jgi:fluoroquinolone transport system permease protein
MRITHTFQSDFLSIIREPVIALVAFVPLFMVLAFKALIVFLLPHLPDFIYLYLDILSYTLVTLLLATPIVMGVVMGFLMLDDRDGGMIELYYVTPLGESGYLTNRILFSFVTTFSYTFLNYAILEVYTLSIGRLIFISVLCSLFAASVGLLFFALASDKIKGLTYAKGMNMFILFAFSDLLDVQWFSYLSALFPTFWLSGLIRGSFQYIQSLVVVLCWLAAMIYFTHRRGK